MKDERPAERGKVNRPWFSVVMPTYNGAAYLAGALNSVAEQGAADLEIIAVDDGSTDDTLQILRAFSDRLPLRVIQRPHVGNWVAITNYGLSIARGEYVSLLHQDDRWLDNRLSVLRALLEQAPTTTLVLHPSWYIDAHGRRVGLWRCPLRPGITGVKPELLVERLLVQNFISIPAPMFTREAVTRIGYLDEALWYGADWDFWLRLATAGKTIYCSVPLAEFRIHPLSQTARRSARTEDFRRQMEVVLEKHLRAWCARGPGRREVSRVARFSLEVNAYLAAYAHGQRAAWMQLAVRFLALGPGGWRRYWRDSRILERASARLRSGMARQLARESGPN